jgi:hypothetical protein
MIDHNEVANRMLDHKDSSDNNCFVSGGPGSCTAQHHTLVVTVTNDAMGLAGPAVPRLSMSIF